MSKLNRYGLKSLALQTWRTWLGCKYPTTNHRNTKPRVRDCLLQHEALNLFLLFPVNFAFLNQIFLEAYALSHHVPFRNPVALFQFETTHVVCALSSCLKGIENSLEPAIGWEGCTPDFLKRKHRCLFNGNSKSLIPLRTNDNLAPSKTANSSFH